MYASISSSTLDSQQTSTIATQTNHVCKQAVKVVIKVVHKITYVIPGLGFSLAQMSEDPKFQQRLLKLLQQQRCVVNQEVDPTARAIVITSQPEVISLEQLATSCESGKKNVEVAIEQPTTAPLVFDSLTHAPTTEQLAKLDYSIAHAIPGRVRFHIPQIASDPQFVKRLETLLQADPTVKSERVNKDAASIVINYETPMLRDAKKRVQNVFAAAVSHLVSLIESAGIAAKAS